MIADILLLFLGLFLILISAESFTNGIETLGRKFSLSQAVVGSLLAAVGTALPETILPVVAIFFYKGESAKDIGMGAILGAPFMLSTLAFFVVGLTVIISYLKKKRNFKFQVEISSIKRDLLFFLPMYTMAISFPFITGRLFTVLIAATLITGYILYAYKTLRCESADLEHSEGMYLCRLLEKAGLTKSKNPHFFLIFLQVTGALAIMITGAHTFVKHLEHISIRFGMSPMLFALILAPIATELPEKFNSITWTWKGRDTLAMGNITGAMVFQSTFPVSVGILFTDWKLTGMVLFSAIIAILSSIIVLMELTIRKRISPFTILFGGALYFLYAIVLITGKIV